MVVIISDAFEDRADHLDASRRRRVVQLEREVRGVIVAERLDIPGAHNVVDLPDPGKIFAPRPGTGPALRTSSARCCASTTAFIHPKDYLTGADARAVLAVAPTPAAAAKLTTTRIAVAVRRGGRKRGVDELAIQLQEAVHVPPLRQQPLIKEAMGATALALLAALDTARSGVDQLGAECAEAFTQHPDYKIIASFPGLGDLTGARVLAEYGDDRARFADARACLTTRQRYDEAKGLPRNRCGGCMTQRPRST